MGIVAGVCDVDFGKAGGGRVVGLRGWGAPGLAGVAGVESKLADGAGKGGVCERVGLKLEGQLAAVTHFTRECMDDGGHCRSDDKERDEGDDEGSTVSAPPFVHMQSVFVAAVF